MGKFFMGCDVSKGYADFVVLDSNKAIILPVFRLDDTPKGHKNLLAHMTKLLQKYPNSVLHIGMESTGGFENNWLSTCEQADKTLSLKTARINPMPVKKHSDASMKRTITDEVSALNIAEYMIRYPEKIIYNQDDPFYPMRRQWNYQRLLKKQSTQLRNHLHSLIYNAHPDLVRFCRDSIPDWVLQLLSHYPTAARLAQAKRNVLSRIPYITITRADELITNASNTIGALQDPVTAETIRQIVGQIQNLSQCIKTQKQFIEHTCSHPALDLLCTFPGIGKSSAVGLMINIRDCHLYRDAKHLASHFGLHPVFRKSGDGIWGMHMSKEGRVQPREILFMVTLAALRYNPLIKDIYTQSLKKKMKPMAAIGVCMHKILRIVYGMLRTGKPFDASVDINYRKRQKEQTTPLTTEKGHVTCDNQQDPTAPVSKRQSVKRKRANGSQSRLATECGITTALLIEQNNALHDKKELVTEMSKS